MEFKPMIPVTKAMSLILDASVAAPVVFSTGYTSRRAAARDRDNHFYMLGSMGMASAIGVGLAEQVAPHPVWVVDGDASFLMNPTSSLLIRARRLTNLRHIVLDNGKNASTGGQASLSSSTDMVALASALGYPSVVRAGSLLSLESCLAKMESADLARESVFLHCTVYDDCPPQARITVPLPELRRRFGRWIETAGGVGQSRPTQVDR